MLSVVAKKKKKKKAETQLRLNLQTQKNKRERERKIQKTKKIPTHFFAWGVGRPIDP